MLNQLTLAIAPLIQDPVPMLGGTDGADLWPLMRISLALIVAIAGLAFGFKKLVSGSVKSRANKRSMQILDVLPLGGKQRLAVVRCYDRTFAIGLGDKEVTAIAELDPMVGAEAAQSDATPADEETFQRALAHVQHALAKTREGVGPARPAHAEAKRQVAAQHLVEEMDAARARQVAAPVAVAQHAPRQAQAVAQQPTNTRAQAAPVQQVAPVQQEAAAAPRKTAKRTVKKKRPATAKAQPAAIAAPVAAAQPAATRKPRRKAKAPQVPQLPSLGLEGVMG